MLVWMMLGIKSKEDAEERKLVVPTSYYNVAFIGR
jgi:hypothetical protein